MGKINLMCFMRIVIVGTMVASVCRSQTTPTEALNQQMRAQFEDQQRAAYMARQQQQQQRQVQTRRLQPPCAVPDSWYPLRTCKVSASAAECAKGFNAWPTYSLCCAPGTGAFANGCTDFDAVAEKGCWIPGNVNVVSFFFYIAFCMFPSFCYKIILQRIYKSAGDIDCIGMIRLYSSVCGLIAGKFHPFTTCTHTTNISRCEMVRS